MEVGGFSEGGGGGLSGWEKWVGECAYGQRENLFALGADPDPAYE